MSILLDNRSRCFYFSGKSVYYIKLSNIKTERAVLFTYTFDFKYNLKYNEYIRD